MKKININETLAYFSDIVDPLYRLCDDHIVVAVQEADDLIEVVMEYVTSAHNADDKTRALAGETLLARLDRRYTAEKDEE